MEIGNSTSIMDKEDLEIKIIRNYFKISSIAILKICLTIGLAIAENLKIML